MGLLEVHLLEGLPSEVGHEVGVLSEEVCVGRE
jgi:hypothetical protein